MAFHSKFNHFFQSCRLPERSLRNIWKNIVNAMRSNKLSITSRSGRALIAKNRIPANYNVGGLQMADTIQKYKCLSIEANFKLLQNVLKNKNYFISLYIKKCEFSLRRIKRIFLSKLIEKLENDDYFGQLQVYAHQFTMYYGLDLTENNCIYYIIKVNLSRTYVECRYAKTKLWHDF